MIVHHEVHDTENAVLGEAFLDRMIEKMGGVIPRVVPSDNGVPMTGLTVPEFLASHGITQITATAARVERQPIQ